ncbi:polyhomeotic-like protein 1 isoform X2 [Scyliorhinus torazame]|uniref:polyhomeotic-like protein 1 isoform X2 n=1 Tax=Scyliorhinus torazame TaxID=75743 RepID=UPI003B5C3F6A
MDNENEQNASPVSGSGSSNGTSGNPRPQVSQMSLYERQAVQALQALQRQPNAAAQYLQQMYAVQHQHMMLQQHLNTAQLQSLAAVQQINLTNSSGTQLSSRAQTVSSPVTSSMMSNSTNTSSSSTPTLTPTQAKMYLQAQLPQPGSLLQVARTLTRNVPQLILMPGGSVTAVQPEVTATSSGLQSDTEQAENLALRNQQTLATGIQAAAQKVTSVVVSQSSTLSPAQTITVSQAASPGLSQAAGLNLGHTAHVSLSTGAKGSGSGQSAGIGHTSQCEADINPKKPEQEGGSSGQTCGINLTRSVTPSGQTLISSAYSSISPHPLLHQHLQQKQLVMQPNLALQQQQHRQSQPAHQSHPAPHSQTLVVQPLSQAQPQSQAQAGPPLLHKLPLPQAPSLASLLPKQAIQPIKVQSSSAHLQVTTKFVAQTHMVSTGMGLGQPQAPDSGSGSSPVTSAAVQQSSASTQTLVMGLAQASIAGPQSQSLGQVPGDQPQAQPQGQIQTHAHHQAQSQAQIQPQDQVLPLAPARAQPQAPMVTQTGGLPQQQPLPLKTAVVGVKRKAEIEDENDYTEKLSAPTLEPPQLTPNQPAAQDQKLPVGGKGEVIHSGPPVLTSISSLNAPTLLKVNSRYGGDIKPPQAIVKPHILTHVIEGFVIQEGAEPFPVDSALASADNKQKQQEPPVLQPENRHLGMEPLQQEGSEVIPELLKCEFCGRLEQAEKFKRSKRFCSMACAKRYNVSCRKGVRRFTMDNLSPLHKDNDPRIGRRTTRKGSGDSTRVNVSKKHLKNPEDSCQVSDNSSYDEALSPLSPNLVQLRQCDRESKNAAAGMPDLMGINPSFRNGSPGLWSVEQVHDFICSLPGCQDLAEEFRSQEIDGQALLLLKEEHLMSAMNMKLGPALKICARINLLKEP